MNDRIKKVRLQRGVSQEEFAKRIGVTKSAISGYETGRRIPPDSIIRSICREFLVDEEWLRYGKGQMDSMVYSEAVSELNKAYNLDPFESAFLERYFSLSKDERREFCNYLITLFGDVLQDFSRSELKASVDGINEAGRLEFQEAPKVENNDVDILAELEEVKARVDAIEKEDEIAEMPQLSKVIKKSGGS